MYLNDNNTSSIRGEQPTGKKYGDLPIELDIFYHEILIPTHAV